GLLIAAAALAAEASVLVTGATGRSGSLLYHALKDRQVPVRALVRNVTKARERLGCSACDVSEGIYLGDVSDASSLPAAFEGVTHLANAVGVFGSEPEKVVKAVEWIGVKNQVQAFLKGGVAGKRVAMISTMGTSTPPTKGNKVMFYKLLAESYLSSAGVSFAIVKPCGLTDAPGGDRLLMAGHDDEESWFSEGFYMIPRADVANATASALLDAPADTMRFDLCAK
ncbi:unnamed protein product, partial [Effrenium voratum]